jgi:hypothetical protein
MSVQKITINDVPLNPFHARMVFYTGGGAFCNG